MKKTILTLIILALSFNTFSQKIANKFNLGFEKTTKNQLLPDNWFQWGSKNYALKIDSTEKYQGKYSILIEPNSEIGKSDFGCIAYAIPANYEANEIEVSGYMKFENVVDDCIGLLLRIDGVSGLLAFDNMQQKKINGTSDWKKYSVKLRYPKGAKTIYIGALLSGKGKLWVDDFQLLIDGKDIEKLIPETENSNDLMNNSKSQVILLDTKEKTDNLMNLCKIWGFLKYYHPQVAKGKFDWDNELIKKIEQINMASTKAEINTIYSDWITGLGKVKICRKCANEMTDRFTRNSDLDWMNDTLTFSPELISKLNFIKDNRSQHQYYIKKNRDVPNFKMEKPYNSKLFPDADFRLLGLFRYWNIINYFAPNKYLIGENWEIPLKDMIPVFIKAKDVVEYNMAIMELTAKINDGHAFYSNNYTLGYFGKNWVPFETKIINNKAVITMFLNDSLCKLNDLQIGDAFIKYDGKNITDLISENSKFIGASNKSALLSYMSYLLLKSDKSIVNITFERNHIVETKNINLYDGFVVQKKHIPVCSEPDNNIGYINMGVLTKKQVDSVMKVMKDKKGIIFDIRNYPLGTFPKICKFLNKEIKPYAKFTTPDLNFPGMFKWTSTYYCGKKPLRYILGNRNVKNNNYYKGKAVLLFNEETQSHAEYSCMALQTAPNVISIGSQTAGADGNAVAIVFPGGFITNFTSLGVYYPDGRETQRIGIIPDIEVKPTIEGIRMHKDEVLERAIEYINKR